MKRSFLALPFALLFGMLTLAADISTVVHQIATYEYGGSASAVREFETLVLKSAGTPDAAAVEKQIISAFPSAGTPAAKDAFCRALAMIGTSASVPLLGRMLADPDTAEMARYALEQIPGQAATDALRAAVAKSPAQSRVGIVMSLGRRKDTASVRTLKPLLGSPDTALANAVATALGSIRDNESREALLAAKPTAAVTDSLLAIAEHSPGPSALSIYRRLTAADYPESVRIAALRGLAGIDAKAAAPLLLEASKSDSQRLQAIGIVELAAVEGVGFGKRMQGLPPRAQVQAMTALIASGKPEVLPILEQGLESSNEAVRVASLRGIAKLGSAKQIPMLAARAASTTGEEQAAARAALGAVRGKDADSAVLNAIATADLKTKVELIRAAGERGISAAPEVLLGSAADTSRPVRAESIRALRETAGPTHVPALVALLVKTGDDNDRKEYERAVASAIRRSKDAPIDGVTSAYKAAANTDVQSSLLGVMGTVGNNEALPVIREALRSSDSNVQRSAINALAAWPSPEPMKDLLTLAQSSPNAAHQVLGLRGYVRLAQLPSNRPAGETAKLLAAGMAAAKRPEEKKLVIAAAQRMITPESLEVVKSVLQDPAVAAEAKAAVTVLERGLMYRKNDF